MTEMSDRLSKWIDACVKSSKEFASIALATEQVTVDSVELDMPQDQSVALIALVGVTSSVQVGIASSQAGCQATAKKLLGMEPEEPDLEPSDIADAMGEAANILAGQIKTCMVAVDPTINLGIPIFIRGYIDKSKVAETAVVKLHVGDIPLSVLVIMTTNKSSHG